MSIYKAEAVLQAALLGTLLLAAMQQVGAEKGDTSWVQQTLSRLTQPKPEGLASKIAEWVTDISLHVLHLLLSGQTSGLLLPKKAETGLVSALTS
jgi:hypothetical protein